MSRSTGARDPSVLPSSYLDVERDRSRPPTDSEARRPVPRPSGSPRRYRWRLVCFAPFLVAVYLLWSFLGAVTTPGNEGVSAKWADWLRSHHAAVVVNKAEAWYYSHHTPPKHGKPRGLNPLPLATPSAVTTPATVRSTAPTPVPASLPSPKPVPLVVSPALPGEGVWKAVGPRVDGVQGMYEAQFRADTIYTGEITSAVWINPRALRIALVPGLTEPGGSWPEPPYITPGQRATVQGAFNGGFRFADARGGFYLDGRVAVPLRQGAASMVIYQDGRINVGAWGSEVRMTPEVVAVLQNLVPMVDHGRLSPAATYTDASVWGATLGAATVVARSGIGVTSTGALVYVAGPALTARTLAESLERAGAVRAMTLDINPEWVTFNFFSHPDPSVPSDLAPSRLYPQMQRPADRYLGPTEESRDFFTVSTP